MAKTHMNTHTMDTMETHTNTHYGKTRMAVMLHQHHSLALVPPAALIVPVGELPAGPVTIQPSKCHIAAVVLPAADF